MKTKQEILCATWTFSFCRCHARVYASMTPHCASSIFYLPSSSIHHNPFHRWCSIKMVVKKWERQRTESLPTCSSMVFRTKECLLQISPPRQSMQCLKCTFPTVNTGVLHCSSMQRHRSGILIRPSEENIVSTIEASIRCGEQSCK